MMVAPCCEDQHSPRQLLMVIHTLIGHCCCLRNMTMMMMMTAMTLAMMTMMIVRMRMRMEPNNWRFIMTEAPWSKLLSCLSKLSASPSFPPSPLAEEAASPSLFDNDPFAKPFPPPPLKFVWNLRNFSARTCWIEELLRLSKFDNSFKRDTNNPAPHGFRNLRLKTKML